MLAKYPEARLSALGLYARQAGEDSDTVSSTQLTTDCWEMVRLGRLLLYVCEEARDKLEVPACSEGEKEPSKLPTLQ